MMERVRRILEQELTPKQREALTLLGIQDVPLEEAAKRMKTNRNALVQTSSRCPLAPQAATRHGRLDIAGSAVGF